MSQSKKNPFCYLIYFALLCASCQKSLDSSDSGRNLTPHQRETQTLIHEVTTILKQVYQKKDALNEVNAAIYSEFEPDESISLRNLLSTSSRLYTHPAFLTMPIKRGSFAKEFQLEYAKGSYPQLDKYFAQLGTTASTTQTLGQTTTLVLPDSNETFLVNNISIYFPYSEDWSSTSNPGDPTINDPNIDNWVTLVENPVADVDVAPGLKPRRKKTYDENGEIVWITEFLPVSVNENYVEVVMPTHIIGIMEVFPVPPPVPPVSGSPIYKIFVGSVRCTKQYDRLFGGGGSEIRFLRGYANADGSGQVNTAFTLSPQVRFKRRDIRRGHWKTVLSLWDTNWTPEKSEQGLGIYEEDNEGSQTYNTNVGYTSNGVTTTIGSSTTVVSKDAIIRNLGMNRNFYFSNGTFDQGWGFINAWPIFDGNSDVSWTLPYQIN